MAGKTPDSLESEIERLRGKLAALEEEAGDTSIRAIAPHIPDNIMVLGDGDRIEYINWTVPELTVEQVIGTHPNDYVPVDFHKQVQDCFTRVRASAEPSRYETHYISEDGAVHQWESRVAPIMRDGKVHRLVSISSNVTERREAAVDRDQLFSLSIDALVVASVDGYFKRVNPAFCKFLGYSSEELTSVPFVEFLHPDDRETTSVAVEGQRSGGEVLDFENRYRCKDGSYRLLSWRANSQPDVGLIYAVARDITVQKAVEGQMRHAQKMQAVGQLAGGVAHDFNNLVLAITVNAELALRTATEVEVREHLEEVVTVAQRCAALTKQLLAVSRRQPLRAAETQLNDLTQRLMQMLRRIIPETIELVFEPADELPLLEADPSQLEQVLMNLCINARDAMPDGGRIVLRTRVLPGGGERRVELSVADNGVGMPTEVRERAFEPFYTTKPPGEGSGLGLATVYGVVDQHGGQITLDSEVGEGTTVTIRLPSLARATTKPVPAQVAKSERGAETILVAEDAQPVRDVVVKVLERAGYRVIVATTGEEAVSAVRRNPGRVALALLDVVMPKMTGPQARREILKLEPGIKVLFTSGYSERSAFGDEEPEDLLEKPYRPTELLAYVRKLLDAGLQ